MLFLRRVKREKEREREEVTSMSEYFICGELHLRFKLLGRDVTRDANRLI